MKTVALKRLLILILLSMAPLCLSHQNPAQTDQNPTAPDEKVYEGKDVDTKVKVLSQPDPIYTFEASRQHVVGIVRLSAVFTGSGQ